MTDGRGWDKPASVEYALDEPEFMAEFGRALATWGNVEHALSSLYAVVLNTKQPHYARASFHSVISFRDKLSMVSVPTEMLTSCFPEPVWKELNSEWRRLHGAVSKASKSRNALAHMHVWHSRRFDKTFGWKDVTKISSLPLDDKKRAEQTISIRQMKDWRNSFESCCTRIRDFERNLIEAIRSRENEIYQNLHSESS